MRTRLVTLQPMIRLMLDAIARREMQLNEVTMQRKKILLKKKNLKMQLNLVMMTRMLQLMTKKL